ncbi:Uncharacterized protein At4g18490 [Linum perenne]
MAETKKAADRKEKKSLLDDEIGDEFLGSWKKMSVPEDDSMDFNFEAVPKGNKKAFNFGNLDMDFNLDGDFDKLSNFKVDMADLDFSSPSEDASKPKENLKGGSSSGHPKGKLDPFGFSFDFNGMDDFNIDGNLTKGDKASGKHSEKKRGSMKDSEWHDPKIVIDGGTNRSESSQTEQCPPPERPINERVKTAVASKGIENSLSRDDSRRPEALGDHADHAAKNVTEEIVGVTSEGTNQESPSSNEGLSTNQGNPSSDEGLSTDQGNPSSDEGVPIDRCAEFALQSTLSQSPTGSASIQDTTSDVLPMVDCLDSGVDTKSEAEQNPNGRIMYGGMSVNDDNQLSKSAPPCTNDQDVKKGENKEIFFESAAEDTRESEPVENDIHAEAISTETRSLGKSNGCNVTEDNHQSSYLVSTEKEPATDKVAVTKEEDTRVVRSRFFRKSGDFKPSLASPGVKTSLFGSSGFALRQLNRPETMTHNVQTGRNLGGQVKLLSSELKKPVPGPLGGGKNVKSTVNVSKGLKDDGVQKISTPTDTAILPDKVIAIEEPGVLKSESNRKNPAANWSIDKMPKLNIQRSLNSSVAALSMKTIHNSKIIPVKAPKFDKQMPSLSRDTEVSRDQPNVPIKTLKGISKNIGSQQNATSQIAHPVTEEQRKKSLKRNSEAFSADLMPLNPRKRISPSRDTSRQFEDKTEGIAEEQVQISNSEVANESGSMLHDSTISGLIIPKEVNLEKPEISLTVEIDRVQMAAEYGRKLDELCNKLRKMIEHTKELSVRSIVNNNRLLLLNHPMLDEKISFHFLCVLQPPSTAISSMVKAIRALGESQAGSEGTAARAAYYASKRSSPGGPDPHHH